MAEPASSDGRVERTKMDQMEEALALLHVGSRAIRHAGLAPNAIDREILALTHQLNNLRQQRFLPLRSRKRPKFKPCKVRSEGEHWNVYLDESGHRNPQPQPAFPVFSVAAVVIRAQYYSDSVVPAMHALKQQFWPGRTDIVFHEPYMRKHKGDFYFNGSKAKQAEFDDAYVRFLTGLDMYAVGAVIDKAGLRTKYQGRAIDDYLPTSMYAIAYDFVLERVCNLLHFECNDALGSMYPEAIGKLDDAKLQLEHARMFVEGTRFVPGDWFQYQIQPGMRFFEKQEAEGIEIADTVARTIADHARGLGDKAACWHCLEKKLFAGHMDCPDGDRWGRYKVFPPASS